MEIHTSSSSSHRKGPDMLSKGKGKEPPQGQAYDKPQES